MIFFSSYLRFVFAFFFRLFRVVFSIVFRVYQWTRASFAVLSRGEHFVSKSESQEIFITESELEVSGKKLWNEKNSAVNHGTLSAESDWILFPRNSRNQIAFKATNKKFKCPKRDDGLGERFAVNPLRLKTSIRRMLQKNIYVHTHFCFFNSPSMFFFNNCNRHLDQNSTHNILPRASPPPDIDVLVTMFSSL